MEIFANQIKKRNVAFKLNGAVVFRDMISWDREDGETIFELGKMNRAYRLGAINQEGYSWASIDGKIFVLAISYDVDDETAKALID